MTTSPEAPSLLDSSDVIYLVEGQEFRVPATEPLQRVRDHLATMLPFVATAQAKEGARQEGVTTIKTVEFVKTAGTKGSSDHLTKACDVATQ